MTMRIFRFIVITGLITFLYGCNVVEWLTALGLTGAVIIADVSGEEEASNQPVDVDCASEVHPIQDRFDAQRAAHYIIRTIESTIEVMPDGSYQEQQLSGIWGGTITISGVISRVENESCGDACTKSYNNHDIIATMQDYHNFDNTVVTGVINYSDDRTEGGSSSAGLFQYGDVTITDNGTDIHYDRTYVPTVECNSVNTEIGVIDTILSITASNDAPSTSLSYVSGQLTTSAGTFIFD